MNELFFMRHAQHIPAQGEPTFGGLTAIGCDEAREIGGRFSHLTEVSAFSINNRRSMTSVALAMFPETTNESADIITDSLVGSSTLRVDEDLSYHQISDTDRGFDQAMNHAFLEGTTLRFFIEESDTYLRLNPNLSTYSTMTDRVRRKLLTIHDTPSIYCGREFFMPSFRARMTEQKFGASALARYVDYYCAEIEWNPEARKMVTKIQFDNETFRLMDSYGVLKFSRQDLLNINRSIA